MTRLGAKLLRPSLIGFLGCVAILLGASQPNSPFTLKLPGAWFFGMPSLASSLPNTPPLPPGPSLFLGVVAVYGGMLLMLRAWCDLIRLMCARPGIPVARLVPVFVAWVAPLLVIAPLFSRDVYSYAAQGEMMSRHINPYVYGTGLLSNGSPFTRLADPMWQKVASPYGPIFLMLDGWIVSLTDHGVLASVELLRVAALAGTVLFAGCVPSIARSYGRDGAQAFALAALNPLILLHLVAGAHNDAIMLGLLALGIALSRHNRPVLGVICCALAAAVKAPAFLGVIYLGWGWLGPRRSVRERLRPTVTALMIGGVVMAGSSVVSGLGWGWVGGLSNPDTVRSWMDPATAIGLALAKLVSAIGLGQHSHILLTLTRATSLALSVVIALVLLARADRVTAVQALGWSLLAIVVLSPVVQPWYLTWGLVLLATAAGAATRRTIVVLSSIGCFLGLPGASVLIRELGVANPWLVALTALALLTLAALVVFPRRASIAAVFSRRSGLGAALAEAVEVSVGR